MFNFTIARKLITGFGLIVVLLVAIAMVGYGSNRTSAHNLEQVSGMMTDTVVGGESAVDMLMVRMNVKDFLIRNDAKDLAEYREWKNLMVKSIEDSRQRFQNPERRQLVDVIDQKFAAYDQSFTQVQQIITERNRLRSEVLDVTGPKITKNLEEAKYKLLSVGAEEQFKKVLAGLLDVQDGRLHVLKFLASSSPVDYEHATEILEEGHQVLMAVRHQIEDNEAASAVSQAATNLEMYLKAVGRVHVLVDDRNRVVKNQLDQLGPEIAALQRDIQESLRRDGAAISDSATASTRASNRMLLMISFFATLMAIAAAYFIFIGTVRPLRIVIDQVGEIAEGESDLTQRVNETRTDEIGELGAKVNAFISRTHDTILAVRSATHSVTAASGQIRSATEEIASNIDEEAKRVANIGLSIEEMDNAVGEVARRAAEANGTSAKAGEMAKSGGSIVAKTIDGMNTIRDAVSSSATSVETLGRRGEQIGEIVAVINEIAEQTNLLALNAAIEAARAGEHGRGFAVVADEVRKLADRTTQATDEIGQSIQAIQQETQEAVNRMAEGTTQVHDGVVSARRAGDSLDEIVSSTDDVAAMIQGIAAATEEQSASTTQIARSVDESTGAIREVASVINQTSTAVVGLSERAQELQALIGRFKLAETAAKHG